jgi:hypothetical protein
MTTWRDQVSEDSIDGSAEKGQEVTSQNVLLCQGKRTTEIAIKFCSHRQAVWFQFQL